MIKRGGRSNESCSEVPRVGSSAVMYDGTRREKWKLPRVTLKPTDTEREKERKRERKKENLMVCQRQRKQKRRVSRRKWNPNLISEISVAVGL